MPKSVRRGSSGSWETTPAPYWVPSVLRRRAGGLYGGRIRDEILRLSAGVPLGPVYSPMLRLAPQCRVAASVVRYLRYLLSISGGDGFPSVPGQRPGDSPPAGVSLLCGRWVRTIACHVSALVAVVAASSAAASAAAASSAASALRLCLESDGVDLSQLCLLCRDLVEVRGGSAIRCGDIELQRHELWIDGLLVVKEAPRVVVVRPKHRA